MKFTTHNDTKKLYKKSNLSFYTGLLLLFPFGLFIFFIAIYLNSFSNEHLATPIIQAPEITTAFLNGTETVIYTYQDGKRTARVQYEKCEEVATITGMVNYCDREIIRIVLDK